MSRVYSLFLLMLCSLILICPGTVRADGTVCRLAYSAKVQYAPQILALQHGWFKEAGADVKGVNLGMTTGISATEALVSGSADVTVMGDVPGIIALASSHPTVLVCAYGGGEGMHSIVVSEKSGIKTIEELRGKRIGCHFGSSTHGGIHLFLEKHGLAKAVTLVNIPQKNLVEALISGSIDGFAASEPAPSLALKKVKGARLLTTLHGLGNSYPLVMVASKSFAEKHPDILKALVDGTLKGVDLIKADPASAGKELATATGAPADLEEATLRKLSWDVRLDRDVITSLEQTAQFLHSIGRLKTVPNIAASTWTR